MNLALGDLAPANRALALEQLRACETLTFYLVEEPSPGKPSPRTRAAVEWDFRGSVLVTRAEGGTEPWGASPRTRLTADCDLDVSSEGESGSPARGNKKTTQPLAMPAQPTLTT